MLKCLEAPFRTRGLTILCLVSFCAVVFVIINESVLRVNNLNTKVSARNSLLGVGRSEVDKQPLALELRHENDKEEVSNSEQDTKSVEASVANASVNHAPSPPKKKKKKAVAKDVGKPKAVPPKKPKDKDQNDEQKKSQSEMIAGLKDSIATKEIQPDYEESSKSPSANVAKIGDFAKCFNFYLDHPTLCGTDGGQSIPLMVIVSTAANQVESRDAIRSTWGGYFRLKKAKVIFLLGKTEDEELQQYVEDENKVYNDIVQADFLDNYENLTLKSVSLMKWVSLRCPTVPFVLKMDDDVMINVDLMLEFVQSRQGETKSIYGKVAKNWMPHRNKNSKYYVSPEQFPGKQYPYFTTGPAYLFTGDSAKLLYDGSLSQPFLRLEDVVLTGIVAQKVGIVRWHQPLMKNVPVKVNICTFKELMTSHKHSPENMESLWEEVTRPGNVCKVPPSVSKKP